MGAFKKIGDGITLVNTKINDLASWVVYPLVLVVVFEVCMRYFFNSPTNWVYDATWMLSGTYFFLGGAYGLHTGVHVKADIIYNMLPKKGQIAFDIFSYCIFFFPVMFIMVYACIDYFLKSYAVQDMSQATSWAPVLWPVKLIMLISMVMLLFQGFVEFGRSAIAPIITKDFTKKEA